MIIIAPIFVVIGVCASIIIGTGGIVVLAREPDLLPFFLKGLFVLKGPWRIRLALDFNAKRWPG